MICLQILQRLFATLASFLFFFCESGSSSSSAFLFAALANISLMDIWALLFTSLLGLASGEESSIFISTSFSAASLGFFRLTGERVGSSTGGILKFSLVEVIQANI